MKKLLIILLIIPVLSNGQTLQGYSGRYFKAIEYFNSPIYKLSGVDLDSANTVKKGFFTKFQYNKLQSAKQKNDSIINSGFATNYKLSLLYPTSSNTLYGNLAGHSISSGTNNVLVGYRAGYLVSSGTKNVMIGHHAGDQSTAVNYCTFVGNNAGYNTKNHYNTFIGAESGYTNRTGANNTFIGLNAGYSNYSGSGSIMIGYNAGFFETGSNKLYIENSRADSTTALVFGNFLTNKLVFNGNVGIGTVIPNKQLHIVGDSAIIRLENADEYGFYWDIYKQKIDESLIITSTSTKGFIGINKINPSYPLDVNGTIRISSNIILNGAINYGSDAEANDTYVCAIAGITAYTEGMIIYIKCNTANTGACSINVNSLGAKALKVLHDQDPQDSYIEAGSIIHAIYDGTNFQVLTPDSNP